MNVGGLLKSILIVGGSQVVNILVSILRVKVVALLLGPAGVGLLGLFNNVRDLAATGAGLGLGSSGVRDVARNREDAKALARTRRVLFQALLIQGGLGAIVIWLFRAPLAAHVFGNAIPANHLGFIALAVWSSLAASAMTALLQGLRRIADLVRVTVIGAFFGTLVGLSAILALGLKGLPLLVLGLALGQLVVAWWFTRRLSPDAGPDDLQLRDRFVLWIEMTRLGAAFMVGALTTTAAMLLVRSLIQQRLGVDAVGQFESSWALSMTYLGFLLNAMAADYYPRLSETVRDRNAANVLVNEQILLGLVVGGPLLLLLIGLAPQVVTLLYSSAFREAAQVLQWQAVGNIFKLSAWAMGFVIVATGRGGLFLLLELSFSLLFGGGVWLLLGHFGVLAAGPAFALAYVVVFFLNMTAARRLIGFRWEGTALRLQATYTLSSICLLVLANVSSIAGATVGVLGAFAGAVLGLRLLLRRIGTSNRIFACSFDLFARIGWPLRL